MSFGGFGSASQLEAVGWGSPSSKAARSLAARRRLLLIAPSLLQPIHPLTSLPRRGAAKMASLTRINLAPTARTLASGVPAARGIALNLPPLADHHHGGPRADQPAKFAAFANNGVSSLRANGGYSASSWRKGEIGVRTSMRARTKSNGGRRSHESEMRPKS